jgi:hypothetical protein
VETLVKVAPSLIILVELEAATYCVLNHDGGVKVGDEPITCHVFNEGSCIAFEAEEVLIDTVCVVSASPINKATLD